MSGDSAEEGLPDQHLALAVYRNRSDWDTRRDCQLPPAVFLWRRQQVSVLYSTGVYYPEVYTILQTPRG